MTPLTRAQKRIVAELRRGGTIEQIAGRMWLSTNTVKTHLRRLYAQYGVHGRDELLDAIGGMA